LAIEHAEAQAPLVWAIAGARFADSVPKGYLAIAQLIKQLRILSNQNS
jgi:hypothetical protein